MRAVAALCVLLSASWPARADDPAPSGSAPGPLLAFGQIFDLVNQRVAAAILEEAYGRLGRAVTHRHLPSRRALEMSNEGRLDGEVARVAAIVEEYPNLIRVEPSIYRVVSTYFSADPTVDVSSKAALRRLRVGIMRGIVVARNVTQGLDVQEIDDFKTLFRLLSAGRLDIGLAPRDAGLNWYRVLARALDVEPVGEPVHDTLLYHFLHQRHAALVPQISRVLHDMADDGTIARITMRMLRELNAEAWNEVSRMVPADDPPSGAPGQGD